MSTILPWLQHLLPHDIFDRPADLAAIKWRELIEYFEVSFIALFSRAGELYARVERAYPGLYPSVDGLKVKDESEKQRNEGLERVRQYLESNKNHINPKNVRAKAYGVENVHHTLNV